MAINPETQQFTLTTLLSSKLACLIVWRRVGRAALLFMLILILECFMSTIIVKSAWAIDNADLMRLTKKRAAENLDNVSFKTWKELRDHEVIKQNFDYSCGSASIATILTYYYSVETSEQEVLELIINSVQENAASFKDLALASEKLGFVGHGFLVGFSELRNLQIPVVVYLEHENGGHFSVLRGIDANGKVWLSDSSLGNKYFAEGVFRNMWEMGSETGGKILAVLPVDGLRDSVSMNTDFFGPPKPRAVLERNFYRYLF